MKYILKAKGRTAKKNLNVNLGGEIKQYSKKDCFVKGIDITNSPIDPKFMSIEDKFVEKIKVGDELKDFISPSDIILNNDINQESLGKLDAKYRITGAELQIQQLPFKVPTPIALGNFDEHTRLCNIDDVYVMLETTGAYYSLDGCLNWQRSRYEDNAFANYNHYGNPMFVAGKKFWWLSDKSLYYTDKTLKTRYNFNSSLQFESADSDGTYIYTKTLNENRIIAYVGSGEEYKTNWYLPIYMPSSMSQTGLDNDIKIECFPGYTGCFIYTKDNIYIINGSSFIEQDFPYTNKIKQLGPDGRYFILGNSTNDYCIFDKNTKITTALNIESNTETVLDFGYDYINNIFLIIDNYGNIKGDNNRVMYDYNIESKTFSERYISEVTGRELRFMCFEDYNLIYEDNYTNANIYDINFNLIASDVQKWHKSKPNLYRIEYGSIYDYFISSAGAVQITKSLDYIVPENIYIERNIDNYKDNLEIFVVDENFDGVAYLYNVRSNLNFQNPENSFPLKKAIILDGNEFSLSSIKLSGRLITAKYTFNNTELSLIDSCSPIFTLLCKGSIKNWGTVIYNNISQSVTKDDKIVSFISYVRFCKNAFTDENGNSVKYGLVFAYIS